MGLKGKDMVIITGPTASGKTALAARIATLKGGEVISADSRQVYRGMDIGTGKDYDDYIVDGKSVPYHLLDIVDPGYKYNVYEYQRDFLEVYKNLNEREVLPVVCGGSGMYIDSIVRAYRLIEVPPNTELRASLEHYDLDYLRDKLRAYKELHNNTDTDTIKRAIRAIEIEEYYLEHGDSHSPFPEINSIIFGVRFDRDTRRNRISRRLKSRLDEGMIDEVRALLDTGLTADDLIYYGLEYKYVTLYLRGDISYEQMFGQLETAIHRFAKRQMTWFRGMERKGVIIHWLDGHLDESEKVNRIMEMISK